MFGELLPGLVDPLRLLDCVLLVLLPLLPNVNKLLELVEKSWLDSVIETSSSSPSNIKSISHIYTYNIVTF
jgi:hypothetical protein